MLTVLLLALLCLYPAIVSAYILVFKVVPPKYSRDDTFVTLFHR
jgi:hypothetical protein